MIRIVGFESRTDPEDHINIKKGKKKNKIDRKRRRKSCASKVRPGERGLARTANKSGFKALQADLNGRRPPRETCMGHVKRHWH